MTGEECKAFIGEIHKYYKKEYPKEALQRAWPHFQPEPAKAMFIAVDRLMLEFTSSMPPLQRVIDLVKHEGGRIRQAEINKREESAEEEKEDFRRGQAKAFKEDSGIAKDSLLVIRAMLSGKISRGEALEGMRHLDSKYPSAGFAAEGSKLKNYYDREGLDMAKPCGSRIPAAAE